MTMVKTLKRAARGTALAAALAAGLAGIAPTAALAQAPTGYRPAREVFLSLGEGELVNLPRNVESVWTSNSEVADVQVNSPRQIGLFGRANGEATIIATAADGSVVYGARVRVSQNISSVNEVLRQAMPGRDISVTVAGQVAIINGTVLSPEESAQAELLVRTVLNPGVNPNSPEGLRILPVNRLRMATPQQVMLQVRIAEVSRSFTREVGVNLASQDNTGGFNFGIFRGNRPAPVPVNAGNVPIGPPNFQNLTDGRYAIELGGRLLGLDIGSAIDLAENDGLVTTLAEPSLVALSGETATFLAGGEFPIPVSQSLGAVTIEYKQYGVGLAFTPTVLEDGRISVRVRPEVSELSTEGSIRLNGFDVPAITTRRTETTVELGSGQSFMIGGLLRNAHTNSVDRAPFLGNLPIIGALFRSNRFRRSETELVIIITPYLVRPVSANQIAMPTDGFRTANDGQRLLLGQEHQSRSGEGRPMPTMADPQIVTPGVTVGQVVPAPAPARPQAQPAAGGGAQPGFDLQ